MGEQPGWRRPDPGEEPPTEPAAGSARWGEAPATPVPAAPPAPDPPPRPWFAESPDAGQAQPGYGAPPPPYGGAAPPPGSGPVPPGYGQPPTPGYGQPGYGQPGYTPPPPGYGQPGHTQPGPPPYGQPGYGQPAPYAQWGWGAAPSPDVKPGVIPLRPLGLGELLDGAVSIVRAHPKVVLGLSAAVAVVVGLVQLIFLQGFVGALQDLSTTSRADLADELPGLLGGLAAGGLLAAAVTGIGSLVFAGLITAVVGRAVLGQPVTLRATWDAVRPLLLRLIGSALLVLLIVSGIALACLLPGLLLLAVGADGAGAALIVLGVIAAFVLGIYAYVRLSLATPALVLERQSVTGALKRSSALVRGDWWRVFGILLLAAVVAGIVSNILQLPFGFGGGTNPFDTDVEPSFGNLLVDTLGGIVATTLVAPFTAGVRALLYVDRRMRAEGLDVTLQQAAHSAAAAGPQVPPGGAPPPGPAPGRGW